MTTFKNKTALTGFLAASFCILIWGITFVCTKHLLTAFSSFEILFYRYLAAYIALWVLYPKTLKLKAKKEELLFLAAGLTGVVIYQLMENISVNYTNASNVSIIVSICPMFTAITTTIFLKEKNISKRFVLGFIISIIGVILVSFNGIIKFNLNPKGDILAFASGISWGFYSVFVTVINKKSYNQIAAIRRVFFYALLLMIPIFIYGASSSASVYPPLSVNLTTDFSRWTNVWTWINMLFLGIAASAFCFVFWNVACKKLGTVKASTGIYLIPVITIIFAFFFLGEKLSLMGILGALCTISGVFVSSR